MRKYLFTLFFTSLLTACSDLSFDQVGQIPGEKILAVASSDFSSGFISIVDPASGQAYPDIAAIHSDALVRVSPFDGRLYVINRLGQDSLQIFNPSSSFNLDLEFTLNPASNPQDIAFYSVQKAFISLYNRNEILVVNTASGSITKRISLDAYADADGYAEISSLHLENINGRTLLFAALQRLNRKNLYKPGDYSLILVIDPENYAVIKSIKLTGTNPNSDFLLYRDSSSEPYLLISCVGSYGLYYQLDGGIEKIHLSDNPEEIYSAGYLITEAELGGESTEFIISNEKLYAILSDAEYNTALQRYDLASKSLDETIFTFDNSQGGFLSGLVLEDNLLYFGSRNPLNPGILAYNLTENNFLHGGPINTGLPPYSIAFIP